MIQIIGRWTMVSLDLSSFLLVVLCVWQIKQQGGVKWSFGKTKKNPYIKKNLENPELMRTAELGEMP